tara:strand:- start:450 stop:743 length:294 start_codon:yes stop_codon:yes gene_type:complete
VVKTNLKKIDIIKNISNKTGLSILISKKLLDDLIESFYFVLKQENLIIKNIGVLKKIFKNERLGRNPRTKKEFIINKRYSISFKTSKKLQTNLNKYG